MAIVSFKSLISNYDAIFLDSYGVVKNSSGIIKGAKESIQRIRDLNIPFRILTNDASRSPVEHAKRYREQGLPDIHANEVITSGMMASFYMQGKIAGGKVAYIGTEQSARYIVDANLEPIPISQVKESNFHEISAMVFLDDEGFDWNTDINSTVNFLRKVNIPVLVANSDLIYPIGGGKVSIATGGIANAIETILGRRFIHYGKPDVQMFMYAYRQITKTGLIPMNKILMVGDTLKTDILGGNKFGVQTALVLSGNTQIERYESQIASTGVIPDYICYSIAD
jgi:HAD superfamily hydrolase (TIGR01450 family)